MKTPNILFLSFLSGWFPVMLLGMTKVYANIIFGHTLSNASISENQPVGTVVGAFHATGNGNDIRGGDTIGQFDFVDDLVGWWDFDEAKGSSVALDSSGNEYHGMVFGAKSAKDRHGEIGKAYGFDGVDDYIELPPGVTTSMSQKLTIAVWVNFTSVEPSYFLFLRPDSSSKETIKLGGRGTSLDFRINSNSLTSTHPSLVPGHWLQLVSVYDGVKKTIYVDGEVIGQDLESGVLFPSNTSSFLGVDSDPSGFNQHLQGFLDEVRIYKRALSVAEVAALYDLGNVGHTFTLFPGVGSQDNASFTIDANGVLKTTAKFDYETKTNYSIRVRFTDDRNATFEKVFSITVTDVDETPTDDPWPQRLRGIPLSGDWYSSSWFGIFWDAGSGWIYHREHGWLYPAGDGAGNYWFYHTNLGWLWTGSSFYEMGRRFLFSHRLDSWLYYFAGTKNFHVYKDESQIDHHEMTTTSTQSSLTTQFKETLLLFNPSIDEFNVGYHSFRIPSLVKTKKGTILAFCEGRRKSSADYGDINLVYKRSTDHGVSWSSLKQVVGKGPGTWGNPTAVSDDITGRIWLFLSWNAEDKSQFGHKGTTAIGVGDRPVFVTYSDDDGLIWSDPVDMTKTLQPSGWKWDAMGPGSGIQTTHGPNAGRLIIPAIDRNIYSDDHGETWQYQRTPGGTSEATIVELSDGRLLRNDRPVWGWTENKRRPLSRGNIEDGFEPFWYHSQLLDPKCEGSSIRYSENPHRLLFLNPASTETRTKMRVRLSYDDGETWPISRQLHVEGFQQRGGYSALVAMANGQIGALSERQGSGDHREIEFHRFNLLWLLDGTEEPIPEQ